MKHLKTFENHLPNHVKQIDLYNINFKDISDFFESLNSKGYNVIRYNTSIKDIFIHKNYQDEDVNAKHVITLDINNIDLNIFTELINVVKQSYKFIVYNSSIDKIFVK